MSTKRMISDALRSRSPSLDGETTGSIFPKGQEATSSGTGVSAPRGTRISLVIPVHDEAENLRELHERIGEVPFLAKPGVEILYVNDGSSDETDEILEEIYEGDPRVRIVDLRRQFGKSAALETGIQESRGALVVTLDADLQDDPSDIPGLVHLCAGEVEMVVGSRQRPATATLRRPMRSFVDLVGRILSRAKHRDFSCSLRCFRREVFEELESYGELHSYLPALAQWRGFRVAEYSVRHRTRRKGRSKFGVARLVKAVFDVLTLGMLTRFNTSPLYFFGFVGLTLTGVGVFVNLHLSSLWVIGRGIGTRPLLLFGVLLIIVGLQTMFFGLLAELMVHARDDRAGYAVGRVRSHPKRAEE